MRPSHEVIKGFEVTEHWVDVAVVTDVVAEVGHWRREDGGEPDPIHAQPCEVVELLGDAFQVSDPVT